MKRGERKRDREEKWSGVCNYGGCGEERERSGVEEVEEGRGECVCNVMKERTEQEEVGEGREERA